MILGHCNDTRWTMVLCTGTYSINICLQCWELRYWQISTPTTVSCTSWRGWQACWWTGLWSQRRFSHVESFARVVGAMFGAAIHCAMFWWLCVWNWMITFANDDDGLDDGDLHVYFAQCCEFWLILELVNGWHVWTLLHVSAWLWSCYVFVMIMSISGALAPVFVEY